MTSRYARGQHAWGECARSGRRMLLKDMVPDGHYPGLLVDPEWYEPRHPQERLAPQDDPVALRRPSPRRDKLDAEIKLPVYDLTNDTDSPDLFLGLRLGDAVREVSVVDSYRFDGSQYGLLEANLTGLTSSPLGTLSVGVTRESSGSLARLLTAERDGTSDALEVQVTASGTLRVIGRSTGATLLDVESSALPGVGTFFHAVVSWDLSVPVARLYVDGSDALDTTHTLTSGSIDYDAVDDWSWMAAADGSDSFDACVRLAWFDDSFQNVASASTLAEFYDGGVVDLRPFGVSVTGADPLIFFGNGHPGDNEGSGQDFVLTGGEISAC